MKVFVYEIDKRLIKERIGTNVKIFPLILSHRSSDNIHDILPKEHF